MAHKSTNFGCFEDSRSGAEAELAEAILGHETVYPWNPRDPEAEAYFADLELEFNLDEWTDEEIDQRSQTLFAQIDKFWEQVPAANETLRQSLNERFADRVPKGWLEAIANKAQAVVSTNLSLADQLVECVSPLLQNWAADDLLIFARPVAYAMRGTELEALKSQDWSQLSEMEKARLSMEIAHYALNKLAVED
jgi:hypothetical protein